MNAAGFSGKYLRLLVGLGLVVLACNANAQWQPDESDKRQVKAYAGVERVKEKLPKTATYFENAYGYAIIPSITRVAIGFGAAFGRGMVIEGDDVVGRTSYFQFSSGLQLGAKYFTLIVFFKDKEAMDDYKKGQWQLTGQAGIDLATVGWSGTPAWVTDVAVFAVTKFGLMAEFSYSGARFGYKSIVPEEEPAVTDSP
jgi:lipid-binding SYLF domain-containing protein